MNRVRILNAIELMKDAKKHNTLHMPKWQILGEKARYAKTLEQLHTCGNKACLGGHLAISPMWKAAGGNPNGGCGPDFGNQIRSAHAVASYFEISEDLACCLIHGEHERDEFEGNHTGFYPSAWEDVTPDMVIEKLELILSGELS